MNEADEKFINTMVKNILEKTGKSVDEWVKIVNNSGLEKHNDKMKFLKTEHGFTHGYANYIVLTAKAPAVAPADDDVVDSQYAGAKADLRPIYNKLTAIATEFGEDVERAPKKAYVAMRRNKQFMTITPATKTRIDIGLNMKGKEPTDRLEAEKPNSMCSHRVRVTDVAQIDDELIGWMREAYDNA